MPFLIWKCNISDQHVFLIDNLQVRWKCCIDVYYEGCHFCKENFISQRIQESISVYFIINHSDLNIVWVPRQDALKLFLRSYPIAQNIASNAETQFRVAVLFQNRQISARKSSFGPTILSTFLTFVLRKIGWMYFQYFHWHTRIVDTYTYPVPMHLASIHVKRTIYTYPLSNFATEIALGAVQPSQLTPN